METTCMALHGMASAVRIVLGTTIISRAVTMSSSSSTAITHIMTGIAIGHINIIRALSTHSNKKYGQAKAPAPAVATTATAEHRRRAATAATA